MPLAVCAAFDDTAHFRPISRSHRSGRPRIIGLPIGSFRQTNGCVLISRVLGRATTHSLGDLGSFGRSP
jgi:hypothetical protein